MIAKLFEIVSSRVKSGPDFRLLGLFPLSRWFTQEVLAFEETEEEPTFILSCFNRKEGNKKQNILFIMLYLELCIFVFNTLKELWAINDQSQFLKNRMLQNVPIDPMKKKGQNQNILRKKCLSSCNS